MTSEFSQWERNLLTLSNSARACSPSLLPRLATCLGLFGTTGGLAAGTQAWGAKDTDDTEEFQETVEGHGEGGAAKEALADLFRRGLSVPESKLECRFRGTGGEDRVGG